MLVEISFSEEKYRKLIADIGEIKKKIIGMKDENEPLTAKVIERRGGTKLTMANFIVELANACTVAQDLLVKSHEQNIYLQGKLDAVNQIKTENDELAKNLKKGMSEMKNSAIKTIKELHKKDRSFADVVGQSTSLVVPMKKSMKGIKKEDYKSKNFVIHGLALSGNNEGDDRVDEIEEMVDQVVQVASATDRKIEIDDFNFLGKLGDTTRGRIAPVLINFKTEEDAKLVLRGKRYLKTSLSFRGVFISPDMDKEERDRQRQLVKTLKERISDVPDKHWFIRNGVIVSRDKIPAI